ncbi:glycoside hydrolase superfamily [Exophiala viscosa]|uniref:alpha-galactosidase n=1 Tax=Exophiala viscosa TaxID=2486360 RepID=A0AAN6DXE9_9EURO|nr:glycoside hydrolase superfamily [Exophiala viscosa]
METLCFLAAFASCLPGIIASALWQPAVGTTWNIQLQNPLSSATTNGLAVWDIDLFDNTAEIISSMQKKSSRVICYFSAGSYEPNRPDTNSFLKSDLGSELDGWPGEYWLDINSRNVRNIMLDRIKLAKRKGCDGIDPDNVDGYANDNGLDLTSADAVKYVTFLADAAHAHNMSIGLKNAGDIIPDVIDLMQWSVNEQCHVYDECSTFEPFVKQGKPVFHIEYPKGDKDNDKPVSTTKADDICDDSAAKKFSTVLKNLDLDAWMQTCKNAS